MPSTAWGLFLASSVALALPAVLLLALRALFAWRYRNMVARYMNQPGSGLSDPAAGFGIQEEPGLARQRLSLRQVEGQASITSIARGKLCEARHAGMRVQRIFSMAGAIQIVCTAGGVYWFLSREPQLSTVHPPLLTAYLTMIPGLAILAAFVVRGTRSRAALLAAYLTAGFGVIVLGPDNILANAPNVVTSHLQIGLRTSALPLLGVGLLLVRRLRPFLLAGAALGVIPLLGSLLLGTPYGGEVTKMRRLQDFPPLEWWLGSAASACLAVAFLFWLLRKRRREMFMAVALLITAVLVTWAVERWLSPNFPVGQIAAVTADNVLTFYLLWLIFQGFIRLQEQKVLPSEILHLDLCWLFLAVVNSYSIVGYEFVVSEDPSSKIRLAFFLGLAPFAGNAIFLHVALRRNWIAHRDRPGRRLLFLRVFGDASKRVRLFDMLGETWRRAGRIDFIAGTDLAQRHVAARALEAFILGRLHTIFLKSPAEVDRRVDALHDRLEGDLRYPINELYCYADAWQYAVRRLAPESDAVIMDLRGFTLRNQGCAFELGVLVRMVPLERIILLTDWTTDGFVLAETIQSAWQAVPADSANVRLVNPKVILIPFTGKTKMDREILESWLFSIVFGATTYPCQPSVEPTFRTPI